MIIGALIASTCTVLSVVNMRASVTILITFIYLHFLVLPQFGIGAAQNLFMPYFSSLGILFGCLVMVFMRRTNPFKYWSACSLFFISWLLYLSARLLVSNDVRSSVYSDLFFLLVLPGIAYLMCEYIHVDSLLKWGLVYVGMGTASGVLVVMWLTGLYAPEDLTINRFTADISTIRGYTTLSIHGVIAGLFLIVFWHHIARRVPRLVMFIAFALSMLAMIAGASRAVWVAGSLGMMVAFMIVHWQCCLTALGTIRLVVQSACLIGILSIVSLVPGSDLLSGHYELVRVGLKLADSQWGSLGGRLGYWESKYGEILESAPVYGHGLGVFPSGAESRIQGETSGMPAADSSLLYLYLLLGWPGILIPMVASLVVIVYLLGNRHYLSRETMAAVAGLGVVFAMQLPINGVLRTPSIAFAVYWVLAVAVKEIYVSRENADSRENVMAHLHPHMVGGGH